MDKELRLTLNRMGRKRPKKSGYYLLITAGGWPYHAYYDMKEGGAGEFTNHDSGETTGALWGDFHDARIIDVKPRSSAKNRAGKSRKRS